MKREHLQFTKGFRVSIGNKKSQAAVMVLSAGGAEGGPDNRHRGADQWLIITRGRGVAIINGRKTALKAGSIVLIEAGDTHETRNTGKDLLKPVSIYVPPAYDSRGRELPPGRAWHGTSEPGGRHELLGIKPRPVRAATRACDASPQRGQNRGTSRMAIR
jgi:mannose-6-phosphate isomerase-like protein (cupin superfamily)